MHMTTTPGAMKRAMLSTWPSVWSLARPSPSQISFSRPRAVAQAFVRCPIWLRSGLRFLFSRHWRVVSAGALPIHVDANRLPAPKSLVMRDAHRLDNAMKGATSVVAVQHILAAPAVEKKTRRRQTVASRTFTKIGAVSRNQMSPNTHRE